jgi:hypothetical protein
MNVMLRLLVRRESQNLFEQSREEAVRRAGQVLPLPRDALPALLQMWEEVRDCFILGQHAAALSLAGGFLEYVLERAVGATGRMDLGPAIQAAKRAGLIDDHTSELLDLFRTLVRNPHGHGDFDQLSGGDRPVTITPADEEGQPIKEQAVNFKLRDMPHLQAFLKRGEAAKFSRPVLQHLRMVCDLLARAPSLKQQSQP